MISADRRLRLLRETLDQKGFVRIIEAHSGISALIGEAAKLESSLGTVEYDGLWESSLTDSASKGLPDVEIVGIDSRVSTINEIIGVTNMPIIVDGDTGRAPLEFEYLVKHLGRIGVSAVIIEDKVFPKRNSLDTSAKQTLADPYEFAQKIQRGKAETVSDEFMIIARLESLIAGTGLEDALARAKIYIDAGVDGIMIHSQNDLPDEILAFAAQYRSLCQDLGRRPWLVCVPTTYNLITDQELASHGFNIIIHANHLLRSSYKAMQQTALAILKGDRNFEAEPLCASTSEIFSAVGFDQIKAQDLKDSNEQRLSIIIPSAGVDPVFSEQPKSTIEVGGKSILDHQIESLRKAGLTNNKVVVVRGHKGDQFSRDDVEYRENDRYLESHSLHSLFCAESAMEDGFLLAYSDILFSEELASGLVTSGGDIVLLIDSSYRYHRHDVDKKLDIVVSERQNSSQRRSLHPDALTDIIRIGKEIPTEMADYEFVGLAYFSAEGAAILRKVYLDSDPQSTDPFHEAQTMAMASITDILQEIINRGFKVQGREVSKGWLEIHNREDVGTAEGEIRARQP